MRVRRKSTVRELLPPQKSALKWARGRSEIALFMEMRLGKTLVAIRWSAKKLADGPVLVICPLSVIPTWVRELDSERYQCKVLRGLEQIPDPEYDFHVTNYEHISRTGAGQILIQQLWGTIILDESTRIKSPRSGINTWIGRCPAPNRAILCGLPAPNGMIDYFEQMKFLYGTFMGCGNFWAFERTYFLKGENGWGRTPKIGTIKSIRRAVRKQAFVMSRKTAGLGSRKIYETRHLEMPDELWKVYRKVISEYVLGDRSTKWRVVVDSWLCEITGGSSKDCPSTYKITELMSLLQGELKHDSVVVWFDRNAELSTVLAHLKKKKVSCSQIWGTTNLAERERKLRGFADGDFRVLLAQTRCAATGLDCSAASASIYYSRTTNYEHRGQSEDRIIHPKKKEPKLIVDLVAAGTIDEKIAELLNDKSLTQKTFMRAVKSHLLKRA